MIKSYNKSLYPIQATDEAQSLAYHTDTATLTLGTVAGATDDDVLVLVEGEDNSIENQVPKLTVVTAENDKGSVTLDGFRASTNRYTACPVDGSGYSVYTINGEQGRDA